jgi:hypothetical protein
LGCEGSAVQICPSRPITSFRHSRSLAYGARDFASGLPASLALSFTPSKRLNLGCEGSAVQICPSRPITSFRHSRSLAYGARDFASGLPASLALSFTPAKRLNLGCEGSAVQICPSRPIHSIRFARFSFRMSGIDHSSASVRRMVST